MNKKDIKKAQEKKAFLAAASSKEAADVCMTSGEGGG